MRPSRRRLISNGNMPDAEADVLILRLAEEMNIPVFRVRWVRKGLIEDYNLLFVANPSSELSGILFRKPSRQSIALFDRVVERDGEYRYYHEAARSKIPQWLILLHEIAHVHLNNLDEDETTDGMYAWEIGFYETAVGRRCPYLRDFYAGITYGAATIQTELTDVPEFADRYKDGVRWGARIRDIVAAEA